MVYQGFYFEYFERLSVPLFKDAIKEKEAFVEKVDF